MKKPLYIGLFLFFIFTSCQAVPVADPETLRLAIGAEPDTLNPLTSTDAYSSRILGYVNDTLLERNRDTLKYEPQLAERFEISQDRLSYTFYLRKNVVWHDGHPFTADDVVHSFERIQDPKVEAPHLRVYYADVERVEKIDDFTVRFVTRKPYFLALNVCGTIPLLPKHLYKPGSDFNSDPIGRAPVGLGPYQFVEWKTNKKIVLQRNEKYWSDKPQIKRIEFKIVSDDTVSFQLLKKGELDYGGVRPIQWVRQTDSEKFLSRYQKLRYLLPGFNYIGWNNKSEFFSDKRVRQAMTHLVDRQKILEKINFGQGRVVESPFFPEAAQYNQKLKTRVYDVKKAQLLLAEAGWQDRDGDGYLDREGKAFKFTFLYPSGSKFSERVAPILKEELKKVGIDMSIERMEWAAFLERIQAKKFDATALGWSTSFDDDPYQVWHSSQAKEEKGSNFISFINPEADFLMEQARQEFDVDKRNALYHRFQEILYEEQPYTFLFSSYSLVVVSKKFGQVLVHKTGLNTLEWTIE